MAKSLFLYGEFVGLSRQKTEAVILSMPRWFIADSIEPLPRGPYRWRTYRHGDDDSYLVRTDPQTGNPDIYGDVPFTQADYNANPCNFIVDGSDGGDGLVEHGEIVGPRFNGPVACPRDDGYSSDLVQMLPVGLTGVEYSDGANALILGFKPGSDVIEYSASWYYLAEMGKYGTLFEMGVKMILAKVSSGASVIALKLFEQKDTQAPARPVNLDVSEATRENLLPGNPVPDDVPELVDAPVIEPPFFVPDPNARVPERPKSHTGLYLMFGVLASLFF